MPSTELFNGSEKLRTEAMDMVNAIRQNHALEHATIALLRRRLEGKVRLIGRSGLTGFEIYGDIPTRVLEEVAPEALRRLQEGEEELAISPACGTNLVVAGLAVGAASMIAGRGRSGLGKFISLVEAAILAILVAQPLGRLAQKHLTTRADLADVSTVRVTKRGAGKWARHRVEVVRE
ncbi:DUF6391 domain-containing protein [Dehalococcoidia bacterium]|nr:DUF6391 domain-containing protein [Dehalococcoidia bacterium]